ncbi:glycosyltransferase family 8 protein [Mesorhizobium sp. ORM6]
MIIVSASDNNFVSGLFILIYSTWVHNKEAKFFVIDAGMEPEKLAELREFCAGNGISCQILQADDKRISDLPTRGKLTTAAYARILIPEMLPDYSKAIYLDADTVVVSDLSDLWSMDLRDNLVAGAVDGFVEQEELDDVDMSREEYINSGVLVINLDAWRRDGIADRIFSKIRETEKSRYLDQTIINTVARGRVIFLDRAWNFFPRGTFKMNGGFLR